MTKKRWTKKQDKELIDGYEAGLSAEQIADIMQADRPGCTAKAIMARASGLRRKRRRVPFGKRGPTQAPKPIDASHLTGINSVVRGTARVTFEIGTKRCTVEVDAETARAMLAKAVSL